MVTSPACWIILLKTVPATLQNYESFCWTNHFTEFKKIPPCGRKWIILVKNHFAEFKNSLQKSCNESFLVKNHFTEFKKIPQKKSQWIILAKNHFGEQRLYLFKIILFYKNHKSLKIKSGKLFRICWEKNNIFGGI